MTTNNHPAHAPLTTRRLHQIRDILSKASAQRDGGDIGYAMSDAVKLIDGAIAAFDAKPVAWTEKCEITNMQATGLYLRGFPDNSQGRDIALYTAPPAPVVPTFDEWLEIRGNKPLGWVKDAMRESYDACRAAMLQGGNPPAVPDGWIKCSDRMPERDVDVQVYCSDKKEQMVAYMERNEPEGWFRFASLPHGGGVYCKPTHWMPLPAAPQQDNAATSSNIDKA